MNIYSEKRIKYMYTVFSLCFGMVVLVFGPYWYRHYDFYITAVILSEMCNNFCDEILNSYNWNKSLLQHVVY